jgi:apolipoprotein N-acyltransferase
MKARAYPAFWRIFLMLLIGVARGSMLALLLLLLFFETNLSNPLRLIRWFTLLCVLPEVVAWLIGRAFEVDVRIESGALVIDHPRRCVEIPLASIERIEPWKFALPGSGVTIGLKSGSRFFYRLQIANPTLLIDRVRSRADGTVSGASSQERADAFALAAPAPRRWYHLVLKFPLFALVPAVPLFRLHQWITYGGTFGEYYLYGLEAYLLAFLIYWANATVWLILYAAGLRAIVAIGVLGVARMAPSRAVTAGRVGEGVHRLLYYGGTAVFLARLYLISRV